MDEENTSTETQTTDTSETVGDIRNQMLKDIDDESSNNTQDDIDSKETDKEDKTSDKSDDKEDDSDKDDSEKDSDKEDEESDDKSDKSKPNRYQRLKAQRDTFKKQVEEVSSERDEAVKYANIYRNRYIAINSRLKQMEKAAQDSGAELNPLDEENFKLRLSQSEQELTKQYEQALEQERIKTQILTQKQEQTNLFITEALGIADKFVQDKAQLKPFARDLLKAHAIALRTDPEAQLKDTARLVASLKGLNSSERIQHEVNSSVKRPIKPTNSGGKPTFKNVREEMMASLEEELRGE